jgi:hypothetical protein
MSRNSGSRVILSKLVERLGMNRRLSRLFYNGRTDAKALTLLQERLFQSPGVKGVAVKGLARSSHRSVDEPGVSVVVATSIPSTTAFEATIEEIVCRVNLRYGTKLKAVLADWKTLDSNFHAHPVDGDSDPSTGEWDEERHRRTRWIVALIVSFLIGFSLGVILHDQIAKLNPREPVWKSFPLD